MTICKSCKVWLKMARRSNTSTPEELAKVLKIYLPNGFGHEYVAATNDGVVQHYEQLICEMLMLTPRPTCSWISKAVTLAYQQVKVEDARLFGQKLAQACQYCFQKKLQMTSGKKLSEAMKRVLKQISNPKRPMSYGERLRVGESKRQLKLRLSNESASPAKSPGKLYEAMLGGGQASAASSSASQLYANMLGGGTNLSGHAESQIIISSEEEFLPIASSSSSSKANQAAAHWFDPKLKALVKHGSSPGEIEAATMTAGPEGFCTATFKDGQIIQTEVPNMLLAEKKTSKGKGQGKSKGNAKSKAAAATGMKRPAAAIAKSGNSSSDGHSAEEPQPMEVSCFNFGTFFSIPTVHFSCMATSGFGVEIQQDVLQDRLCCH